MANVRRPSLRVFLVLLAVLATVGLVADAFASLSQPLFGHQPAAFILFSVCCLGTELRPLRWLRGQDGGEVTASWTFMLALLLVGSPVAAVAVAVGVTVVGDLIGRKPADRLLFNASQLALATTAGAWVLLVGGQDGALVRPDPLQLQWLAVFAAAAVALFAINGVLTCTVIALHTGAAVTQILRRDGLVNASTDGMLLALSPIFVVVAERSLLLLPLLLLTTWSVYRSASVALRRRHEAYHDALTGLPNRRMFDEILARAIERATKSGATVGVVALDLDGFKTVNDRFGHQFGDQVLCDLAERLDAARRPTDLVARLGGDEFAIVVTNVAGVEGVTAVARRVRDLYADGCEILGLPLALGTSVGLAVLPDHAQDAETLLRLADQAMYRAKREHLGLVVHDARPGQGSIGRIGIVGDLAQAMERGELFLDYQPQVDLVTEAVIGAEALMRWEHPRAGSVGPATFMPLVEHTELIRPLTDWVLDQALAQCARWRDQGHELRVSVNASARDVADRRFPVTVARLLDQYGLPGRLLEVEITENALAGAAGSADSVIQALRERGVAVSIDDFGTGYSSMAQLRDLAIDQIKVDHGFVSTMVTDRRDRVIVEAIIRLGCSLGIETVAEGVEDEATADLLRSMGCTTAQGYHYARPMSASAVAQMVRRHQAACPTEPGLRVVTS